MYVFLFYFHDADTPAVCHGMEHHEFNQAEHGRWEKRRVSGIERERASRAVAEQQAKASSQGVDATNSSREGLIGN